MRFLLAICLTASICLTQCRYSLDGIDIPQNAKTYSVDVFKVSAPQAPALLGQTFAEALIDKLRRETRLQPTDQVADYEITGNVVRYNVDAVAPQGGNETALNRLNMTVAIDFVNNLNEEDSWKQNFPYFYDFDSQTNLLDVEEEAIEAINEQLLEDIFRRAFTNW